MSDKSKPESLLNHEIVMAVLALRDPDHEEGYGTLCSDVAAFLNNHGFDSLTSCDVRKAFKWHIKDAGMSWLRSIGYGSKSEPTMIFYLGDLTFPDVPSFDPRAPYKWLHTRLLADPRWRQGVPFSTLRQEMRADGVYQHAPGHAMQDDEIEDVLDFSRVSMIMEGRRPLADDGL